MKIPNELDQFGARVNAYRQLILDSALWYAGRGYPIFPVNEAKKPLVKWGKGEDDHPNLRQRRATCDDVTVRLWWAKWPLAMIGLPTGRAGGFVVLDVDRKNGVDGLEELRAVGIDPFALTSLVAQSPTGGLHFYFRRPPSGKVKNAVREIPGVDVRGDGGFIVLPPSIPNFNGPAYAWVSGDNAL